MPGASVCGVRRTLLEVAGLTGGWDQTTIVEDVTLSVAAGERVAIVGRNGVGKSTLLELIVGRGTFRRAGTIAIGGVDVTALPVHRRIAAGLTYVPQQREVFPSLTVRENLEVACRPGPWSIARIGDLFPGLARRFGSLGSDLSGGEQQMLAISRALVGNPKILIMDEPSEGLAPVVVEQLGAALAAVTADATLAMLLVEQRIDLALDLSDRCLVMERGRIVFERPSETLRAGDDDFAVLMGLADPKRR